MIKYLYQISHLNSHLHSGVATENLSYLHAQLLPKPRFVHLECTKRDVAQSQIKITSNIFYSIPIALNI